MTYDKQIKVWERRVRRHLQRRGVDRGTVSTARDFPATPKPLAWVEEWQAQVEG